MTMFNTPLVDWFLSTK